MFAVFNIAIFTGAFLIFLIQPMIANILLPKVGGSPIYGTQAQFSFKFPCWRDIFIPTLFRKNFP